MNSYILVPGSRQNASKVEHAVEEALTTKEVDYYDSMYGLWEVKLRQSKSELKCPNDMLSLGDHSQSCAYTTIKACSVP